LSLSILVRAEETRAHVWQPFQYALKQHFSTPALHRAYLTVLEDWSSTIAELTSSGAFAQSGMQLFPIIKI
jgi:hypothetical protein